MCGYMEGRLFHGVLLVNVQALTASMRRIEALTSENAAK